MYVYGYLYTSTYRLSFTEREREYKQIVTICSQRERCRLVAERSSTSQDSELLDFIVNRVSVGAANVVVRHFEP